MILESAVRVSFFTAKPQRAQRDAKLYLCVQEEIAAIDFGPHFTEWLSGLSLCFRLEIRIGQGFSLPQSFSTADFRMITKALEKGGKRGSTGFL